MDAIHATKPTTSRHWTKGLLKHETVWSINVCYTNLSNSYLLKTRLFVNIISYSSRIIWHFDSVHICKLYKSTNFQCNQMLPFRTQQSCRYFQSCSKIITQLQQNCNWKKTQILLSYLDLNYLSHASKWQARSLQWELKQIEEITHTNITLKKCVLRVFFLCWYYCIIC